MVEDVKRLLRGRVAVRPLVERYHGRLVLPDTAADTLRKEQGSSGMLARSSHRGRVLAMGEPARTARGDAPVPAGFEVGDEVVYVFARNGTEDSRTSTWRDGEPVVWLAQEEVIAVVEPCTHPVLLSCMPPRCRDCGMVFPIKSLEGLLQ